MKSRPKSGPLLKPYDPVVKDYKMYKSGKFWRFAFTMFAGTVIGGGSIIGPSILSTSGLQVTRAAAGDTISETRPSDAYVNIRGTEVHATITVSGIDDGSGHIAVDQPVSVTVDGLPKEVYLERVTLVNTTTGAESDPVQLDFGDRSETGGVPLLGWFSSTTVAGAGGFKYTFPADIVEQLFGESGGYVGIYVQPLSPNPTLLKDIQISNDDGVVLNPGDTGSTGSTGDTGDTGDTAPVAETFTVNYKYLDDDGNEIPDSAQSIDLPLDGNIDFTPLSAPANYEFSPAKTTTNLDSTTQSVLQSTFAKATNFADLTTSLADLGLDSPNEFKDHGISELTITYQGKKTQGAPITVNFISASDPTKQVKKSVTLTGTLGASVDFSQIDKTVDDWTLTDDGTSAALTYGDSPQSVDISYTQKKHNVTFNLVDPDGNPVKNTEGKSTFGTSTGYTAGSAIAPAKYWNFNVPGYTMQEASKSKTQYYTVTSSDDQVFDVVYDKIPTGTVTVNLVDQNGKLVEAGSKKNTYSYTGPIGEAVDFSKLGIDKDIAGYELVTDGTTTATTIVADNTTVDIAYKKKAGVLVELVDDNGTVISLDGYTTTYQIDAAVGDVLTSADFAKANINKELPGYRLKNDGTSTAYTVTDSDSNLVKIVFEKIPDVTLTVNLVDTDGKAVTNTDGKSVYTLSGQPDTDVDWTAAGINKTVTGYQLAGDGTIAPLKFAEGMPVVKITFAKEWKVTVSFVDEAGSSLQNTDGQSSVDYTGVTGDTLDFAGLNKTVDGYTVETDPTASSYIIQTGDTQSLKIVYKANGPHIYTPTEPGNQNDGDPIGVTSRYLIATVGTHIHYTGDVSGLPTDKEIEGTSIYRTATIDDSGTIHYTPWTTNPSGTPGSDDTILLSGITNAPQYVPVVAGAKAVIDDTTNQDIKSPDLQGVAKTVGNVSGVGGGFVGKNGFTAFVVTRNVNYTADTPNLQWHQPPTATTDPHYDATHKTLTVTVTEVKDGNKTIQNTQTVTLTREYQKDDNSDSNEATAYGDWTVANTYSEYTPTTYDGYTADKQIVASKTSTDDGSNVDALVALMQAADGDADQTANVTVTYTKDPKLVVHPAPDDPTAKHYDETHKTLTIIVDAIKDGETQQLDKQELTFSRTYTTDENDPSDTVVEYGAWTQDTAFKTVTPEVISGYTVNPTVIPQFSSQVQR
ncbi:KxYKxGKxW signal peptide domain-containing protein [Lacticaseibacillus suibinensis]|uniref:KxYKxGKxW signal peptide domain-containing protein n=1 Tax=Lacticaseibacillus suibinensis TaxID=2486011 RepID=UPI00194102AE|nr:KxYKxGKxW signal peptide domain-containing protein [Lacticaseibacillus suibinensis]